MDNGHSIRDYQGPIKPLDSTVSNKLPDFYPQIPAISLISVVCDLCQVPYNLRVGIKIACSIRVASRNMQNQLKHNRNQFVIGGVIKV